MEYIFGLGAGILFLISVAYFLPSVIALLRGKSNTFAIILLNIFLGWTFVGWVVALVWSFTSDNKSQTVVINNSTNVDNQATKERTETQKYVSPDTKSILLKKHQVSIQNLQEIKDLLDNGVLTQDEFNKQKSQILSA